MNNEELYIQLQKLKERLTDIKKNTYDGINIFAATGMSKQEVKHSAFLSWLLNPKSPHNFGTEFLAKFLYSIYNKNDGGGRNNRAILGNEQFYLPSDFNDILTDDKLEIVTEKSFDNGESRIDIFIDSPTSNTTIIIENKTFTTAHDDQLNRYKGIVQRAKRRKILVYLTPRGTPPDANDDKEKDWALLSYRDVINAVKELAEKQPPKTKLRYILEDYIEMTENEILNENKKLRSLCKEIKRDYGEALEVLNNYTDNIKEVTAVCDAELKNKTDYVEYGKQLCTKTIERLFKKFDCPLVLENSRLAFFYGITYKDGPVSGIIALESADGNWNAAQRSLAKLYNNSDIKSGKYYRLYTIELLSEEERGLQFESVKPKLLRRLEELCDKINSLDKRIDNICLND